MDTPRKPMVISHWGVQIAILTCLVGFVVLGIMAYKVHTQHLPIPQKVVSGSGDVVFPDGDIQSGQQVFRKYGLMPHGTIFGHGAYLGPSSPPTTAMGLSWASTVCWQWAFWSSSLATSFRRTAPAIWRWEFRSGA